MGLFRGIGVRLIGVMSCVAMATATVTQTLSSARSANTVYSPSQITATTTLPSGFTANSNYTYYQLDSASSLYYGTRRGCNGWVQYFGTTSSVGSFSCNFVLLASSSGFNCSGTTGMTIVVSALSSDGSQVSATAHGGSANDMAAIEQALQGSLLSWLLLNWADYEAELQSIYQGNKDRHDNAKNATAIVWTFIGVAMLQLMVLGTVWITYIWKPLEDKEGQSILKTHRLNQMLWFFLLVVSINVISLCGGFLGWVISGSIIFLLIFCMNFLLYPVRRSQAYSTLDPEAKPEFSSRCRSFWRFGCWWFCRLLWCPKAAAERASDKGLAGQDANVGMKPDSAPDNGPDAASEDPLPVVDIEGREGSWPREIGVWAPIDPEQRRPAMFKPDFVVLLVCWLLFLLTGIITMIYFFPGWTVDEYNLLDRTTKSKVVEYQPSTVAKALQMMYAWDKMAVDLKFNTFAEILTWYCGETKLDDVEPGDRKAAIYDEWIDKYSIDMSQYTPTDYMDYPSVNAWFIRNLATGARPVCAMEGPAVFSQALTAPADARVMGWQNSMGDTRYWIKNTDVDASSLLGSVPAGFDGSVWNGGPFVIFRLAPQDYHRFHSPVTGTVSKLWEESGAILSVSADAAISKNKVLLNDRKVIVIDTTCCGKVAYIAIGATCVGSVVLYKDAGLTSPIQEGDQVTMGDQLGIMQFGGSTVVMLFEPNRITLDSDILRNTGTDGNQYAETYMQMGETFAQWHGAP